MTYYATLYAGSKDGTPVTQVDCRPSDALALALRTGAAIEIASEVLEQAGQDSGTFTDSIPTGEKLLSLQPMEIGIPFQEFLSRTAAAAASE